MRGHDFHTTLAEGVLFENGHYQFISRIDQRYGTLKGGDGESLDRNTRVIRNAPYFFRYSLARSSGAEPLYFPKSDRT